MRDFDDQEQAPIYPDTGSILNRDDWRRLYAGMAMQGTLYGLERIAGQPEITNKIVRSAVIVADALLAELEKGGSDE